MADQLNIQSFSNQVAQTFGLNPSSFSSSVSTLPVQNDASIFTLAQDQSATQGTAFIPNSISQEAAAWGVPESTVTSSGYNPATGDNSSIASSLGLDPNSNPAAALGQPLTSAAGSTGSGGVPTSLKDLFSGSLINVVFIVIGAIMLTIGGAMMVSRNA